MKTLFTFIIMVVLTNAVLAQEIKFGPRAGLNFSTFTGEDANYLGIKPGLHVGGFVSRSITDRISVQPELLFSMKGASRKTSSFRYAQTLYYLDIPLFCGIGFSDHLRGLFGLQPSIYLGGTNKVKDPTDRKTSTDARNIRGFDIALAAGLEYQMENGLNFGARINYGFLTISKVENYKVNNLNFQATVGYSIGK